MIKMLRNWYKKLLVKLIGNHHMEHPTDGYVELEYTHGDVEISITDDLGTSSSRESKQSLVNKLILTGVLKEGQIVKSEDE